MAHPSDKRLTTSPTGGTHKRARIDYTKHGVRRWWQESWCQAIPHKVSIPSRRDSVQFTSTPC